MERRNWVIDRMVENGYVSQSDGAEAKKQLLGVTARSNGPSLFASDYFAEAVRRQLIGQYGENALYEGGLSVRTSLDPQMQARRPQGAAGRPDDATTNAAASMDR